jgi:hypothetical protein
VDADVLCRPDVPGSAVRQTFVGVHDPRSGEVDMRIGSVIVVLWLLVGVAAAYQRDYFSGKDTNCARAGTVAVTVIAGPLNYLGVNPKVTNCKVPQPSR